MLRVLLTRTVYTQVEDDARHPCVGYEDVPARERASYAGSMRELQDRAAERLADASSDSEAALAVDGRPPRRRNLPADKRVATTDEVRDVRVVVGNGASGAELWFYVPHMRSDQNRRVRRGWWLHACEGVESDLQGHYYIGPLEQVQRTATTIVEDVGVLQDFPFVRTVKLTARGEEIASSIFVRTARPFSDDDLALPRAAMRTAVMEVEAQRESPPPPPAPRARGRHAAQPRAQEPRAQESDGVSGRRVRRRL